MKTFLACSLIALGAVAAGAPAMAQGVYIGPGGVGVDTGLNRGYHRGYDRDREYRHHDDYYEGRSAYRDGYRDHRYRDDR